MSRIIGIDYGAKRVGIAVSDDSASFAFPHAVLPNNNQLLDSIADLANKQVAELIVLGESDNPAGGENTITRRITIFGEALKIRTALPVVYVSEAYSTKEARRVYETVEKNRKSKTPVVDDAAATIILQSYLDACASSTAKTS